MTKSRTLRKAGAVVLSLAMAFSVAGVAPSADAAAKKPALSAKKGTITVGKTKAVKIQNTTKKKVKKLVVSSSNKKVATVKKKNKVKFIVTGIKAGTAKITAKVTLKKAVAKKKVYTLKYTATVKKAAVTPTEAPIVAVTGVAINNTTPKVGDTLSAALTPSDASNPAYQWYADGVAIEGATASTYTVAETDINKKIKVTVTAGGNTVSSDETSAVTAEVKKVNITAKQTGASSVEVTSDVQIVAADSVALTRGGKDQEVKKSISEDGKTITLLTSTPIGAAEYTVKVTPADKTIQAGEATFTGEVAALKEIKFLSDKLILTSTNASTAAVIVKGFNQFNEEVALSSLTAYCSGGTASYDKSTSKVTVTSTGVTGFAIDSVVTVTVVYQNGTTVLQQSASLTVSAAAYVQELTFGDLATTKTSLKDAHVTHANLQSDTYYRPVTAKDQYGNALSKADLNNMVSRNILYVTPNTAAGAYVYANGFDELSDGTVVLKFSDGGLTVPGTQTINVLSVGGVQTTTTVDVEDNGYIAELDVTVPELYSGVDAEITISAKNQYGDDITMADLYAFGATQTNAKTITFGDTNNLTNSHSSLTVNSGSLTVTKSAAKKTLTFTYSPVNNLTADATEILTINTAKPAVTTKTLSVSAKAHPAGIKGLSADLNAVIGGTNTTVALGTNTNIVFTDTYGSALAASNIEYPLFVNGRSSVNEGKFYYNVKKKNGTSTTITPATGSVASAGNGAGEDTYTITLYKSNNDTTDTSTAIASADVKITVADTAFKSYTANVKAGDELLWVEDNTSDSATIEVYGVDGNGNKVKLADSAFSLSVSDDLVATGAMVTAKAGGSPIASGKVEGTATVSVLVKGNVEATCELKYSNATPVATSAATKKGAWNTDVATTFGAAAASTATEFTAASTKTAMITMDEAGWQIINTDSTPSGDTYFIAILDQYGLPMANQTIDLSSSDGSKSSGADGDSCTLTYDEDETTTMIVKSGKISSIFTIMGNDACGTWA